MVRLLCYLMHCLAHCPLQKKGGGGGGGGDVSFPFLSLISSYLSLSSFLLSLHFEKEEKRRLRCIYAWRQPSEKERKKSITSSSRENPPVFRRRRRRSIWINALVRRSVQARLGQARPVSSWLLGFSRLPHYFSSS